MQQNIKNIYEGCEAVKTRSLCVDCIEREIEAWLRKHDHRLIGSFKGKTEEFIGNASLSEGITCIFCRKPIDICSHCYVDFIENWISKKSPDLRTSFKLFFKF